MTDTSKEKILRKFIINNGLSFYEGVRNTSITILSGYALYINASEKDCKNAIKHTNGELTYEVEEEVDRVYEYAENNDYGSFWNTKTAEEQYEF